MKRPTRPPGPPPLVADLKLIGLDQPVTLEFDTEAEPDVVARIAEMIKSGAYVGAEIKSRTWWLALELGRADPNHRRVEPRRVKHSAFGPGSIGWSWERVASDGRGEIFVTRERMDGLDASYAEIGRVTAGLEALLALPVIPDRRIAGAPPARPILVDSIRRAELGIAAAR